MVSPLLPVQPLSPLAQLAIGTARQGRRTVQGGFGSSSLLGGPSEDRLLQDTLESPIRPSTSLDAFAPQGQNSGFLQGANLPLLQAGLGLIDPALGQQIGGMIQAQQQGKKDALNFELKRRNLGIREQEFEIERAQAKRKLAAQQSLSNFIERGMPDGSRKESAKALLDQSLSGVEGAGDDLAELLANEPIVQNDQFFNRDVIRAIVDEAGVFDASVNKKQAEDQRISRGNLAVSQATEKRLAEAESRLDTTVTKIPQPDGSTRTVLIDKQSGEEIRELGQGFSTLTAAGELPASAADQVQASRDMLSGARTVVSRVRRSLQEAPARGGLVGTVKGAVQTFTGIASDFLSNDLLSGYLDEIASDITDGRTSREVGELFDPELPRNALAENQLAYALARARKPTGRINVDDVKRAAKDTKITGLFESADVKERLKAIDEEFERAIGDIDNRLKRAQDNAPSQGAGGVPRFRVEGGGLIRIE